MHLAWNIKSHKIIKICQYQYEVECLLFWDSVYCSPKAVRRMAMRNGNIIRPETSDKLTGVASLITD